MSTPSHDPLDPLLERWGTPPANLNVPLEHEVWRRIAVAEPTEPSPFEKIELIFARPSFAIAFTAACMLLGLFLAEARVSRLRTAREHELLKTYIQLIDPLLQPPSHRTPTQAHL